ncbi:MAG: hypothetical protein JWM80_416 [Cyanobacteria bacterium RYN_339]|nr:hypothetical protein [Cyanobacteria bacterium RYN_339]
MTFAITNPRTGQSLATAARRAGTFWTRFRGLMGVRHLPAGEGLLIVPCNSIHCFGMKMAIDVVFVSREGEVLHLIPDMAPGKFSSIIKKARAVIELPAGTIAATGTAVGDRLAIDAPL